MTSPVGRSRVRVVGQPGQEDDSRRIENPEVLFFRGILAAAVDDLLYGKSSRRAEVIEWMLKQDVGPLGFAGICQRLELDPAWALRKITQRVQEFKELEMANAKVTDEQIRELHHEYITTTTPMATLAARHGISQARLSQHFRVRGLPTRPARKMTPGEAQMILGRQELANITMRADYPAEKEEVEDLVQHAYSLAEHRVNELQRRIEELKRELAKKDQELSAYKYPRTNGARVAHAAD